MSKKIWLSFSTIRKNQFAQLIGASAQADLLPDDVVKRIAERRDEREKFLLKGLIFQIALYVALIGAPTSQDSTITLFGFPFKAVREVCLFLLGTLHLIAIFNSMTIKVLTDFIDQWKLQTIPANCRPLSELTYPSIFSAHYWAPPAYGLRPTGGTKLLTAIIRFCPVVVFILLFLVGLAAATEVAYEAWSSPTLKPLLSRSVVLFFVGSYLLNFFYAVTTLVPLPYQK